MRETGKSISKRLLTFPKCGIAPNRGREKQAHHKPPWKRVSRAAGRWEGSVPGEIKKHENTSSRKWRRLISVNPAPTVLQHADHESEREFTDDRASVEASRERCEMEQTSDV